MIGSCRDKKLNVFFFQELLTFHAFFLPSEFYWIRCFRLCCCIVSFRFIARLLFICHSIKTALAAFCHSLQLGLGICILRPDHPTSAWPFFFFTLDLPSHFDPYSPGWTVSGGELLGSRRESLLAMIL